MPAHGTGHYPLRSHPPQLNLACSTWSAPTFVSYLFTFLCDYPASRAHFRIFRSVLGFSSETSVGWPSDAVWIAGAANIRRGEGLCGCAARAHARRACCCVCGEEL
uniref:Uncharacterized protein n=1 Tax=Trypanosoma vivax (strain Y486) TaxID=1055687 RepID=G0TT82_TRYVY|nr:hypothetical protein TVY486_0303390 [Trypanosoma vivax Y486]